MFDAKLYAGRRQALRKQVKSGLILFLGHDESPMNYPANPYPFRQDSSFLYFFGLDTPGLAAVLDADAGTDRVFGDDIGIEDIIWMGYLPTVKQRALAVGVKDTAPLAKLEETLKGAAAAGRKIHFPPPYRSENARRIEALLGLPAGGARPAASLDLIKAIVDQRFTRAPRRSTRSSRPSTSAATCTSSPWRRPRRARPRPRSRAAWKASPWREASIRPSPSS